MGGKSSFKEGGKEKAVAKNEVDVYVTESLYDSSLLPLILTQELI